MEGMMKITDEMVETALITWFKNEVSWDKGMAPWSADQFRAEMRATLEAALSASPAGVKPLEWRSEPPYRVARPFFGIHYAIEVIWPEGGKGFDYIMLTGPTIGTKRFASLSDAQAAAFADYSARIMSAIEPAGVGVEAEVGWIKITGNLPHEVATTITEENQVLAYERGRYFNAWLIFDEYEGGWCWKDEADSEPSPSHYRWLREVALKGDEQ